MANIEYDNLRRELEALKTDFTALRQHNQELQGQIHTLQVDKLGLAEQAESNEKTGQFITAVVKFINTFMGKSDQENIMTLSSNDKPRLSE